MRRTACLSLLTALAVLFCGCGLVGLPGSNVRGCYPYPVAGGSAGPGSEPLTRFIAMGDFGTAQGGRNRQVAAALEQYLASTNIHTDRVFELGDNFYYHGLIGTGTSCGDLPAPPQAVTDQALSVLQPFEFLRDRGITLTAIAGNHDYGCGGQGLVNQIHVDRWLPPAHRWGRHWEVVAGLPRAILLGNGAVQVIVLDSERMITDRAFRARSARVLKELLAQGRRRYRWRILAAHHPLRTNGVHDGAWWKGALPKVSSLLVLPSHALAWLELPPFSLLNQEVYSIRYAGYRRAVEAAVRQSGAAVALFLAGHDHQLQLLAPDAVGEPFVLVSGSAAKCSPVRTHQDTLFAAAKNGFAVITAYPQHLDLDFVGTTGCCDRTACAPSSDGRPHRLFTYRVPAPGTPGPGAAASS
ncbi:MAG: metallophosphoesterase [Candidatus Binatia bacterium]